jgi:hypothetical protein
MVRRSTLTVRIYPLSRTFGGFAEGATRWPELIGASGDTNAATARQGSLFQAGIGASILINALR